MELEKLKNIVESALFAAGRPVSIEQLLLLFDVSERPDRDTIRSLLELLDQELQHRGIALKQTASGYSFQVRAEYSPWVSRLWEEKPPRYSRAFLETLALVAYQQPVSRGEIEAIRGVSVSTNIMRTLTEHDWIKIVGFKDVPGKPALYATTKNFLDAFSLKSLSDLPSLTELRNLEEIGAQMNMPLEETIVVQAELPWTEYSSPALTEEDDSPELPQVDIAQIAEEALKRARERRDPDEENEEDAEYSEHSEHKVNENELVVSGHGVQ